MNENNLEQMFIGFLLEQGYPKDSLVIEHAMPKSNNSNLRPDLLILDVINNEYLAIIEFKNAFNKNSAYNALIQFKAYINALKNSTIPLFLVTGLGDNEFQIHKGSLSGDFSEIQKSEFPSFQELYSNSLLKKKLQEATEFDEKVKSIKTEALKKRLSSIGSLIALSIAIISTLITAKYKSSESDELFSAKAELTRSTLDSISKEIIRSEKLLAAIRPKSTYSDTITYKEVYHKDTILVMKTKIDTMSISSLISEIERLKFENQSQKDLFQAKIDAIKDSISMQNTWVSGILIALLVTVVAFSLPGLFPKSIGTK